MFVVLFGPEKKEPVLQFSTSRGKPAKHNARILFFLTALLLAYSGLAGPAASGESSSAVFQLSELTIVGAGKSHRFRIEVARTPAARRQGLMQRRSLDSDAGMLFEYGETRPIHMWMKNTLIPLDMLFIDRSGIIVGIEADTVPFSTRVIPSPGPVAAVLELNAGTAVRLAIKPGDRVLHEYFATE